MNSEKFFCNRCHKMFSAPEFYNEKHGLDAPPYERIAVCPKCSSDDFLRFDTLIEKIEIAEKLLPVIMQLNRYIDAIRDVFGIHIKNDDLLDGLEILAECIGEMFCFIDIDMQKKVFEMRSEKELNKILMYLKGEL